MRMTSLRVCLIATELQGRGAYGGFGVLTRDIALGLAARGAEVYVVTPRKAGQPPIERSDNVTIVSYPSPLYVGLKSVLPFAALYRTIDADVYHSEEPSLGTALAQAGAPHRKHLVTFQDPRNLQDWRVERAHEKLSAIDLLRYYLRYQWESGRAARRADRQYCQARCIIDKTRRMYRLPASPAFLPNPVRLTDAVCRKADVPTVCYLGRFDQRKRPELFFDLAARCPTVKFVAVGACLNDKERDRTLRERCRTLKNVEAPGWLPARERGAVLDKAWVLVNTSSRECLPVTYLEAGVHKCAILSHCDADDFASRFGFWARNGDLRDFEQGLSYLLGAERWKEAGEKAHEYVRATHEYSQVIDRHIEAYEQALTS
jgi:glycosyltransferase involved in cell wall biosynthesis